MNKKVTGIGGIFFKTENPEKMKGWYNKNLGLVTDEYGSPFEFRNANNPDEINYLQWSPFSQETKYFEPSKKEFLAPQVQLLSFRAIHRSRSVSEQVPGKIGAIG